MNTSIESSVLPDGTEQERACETHGRYIARLWRMGARQFWSGCEECSKDKEKQRAQERKDEEFKERVEQLVKYCGAPLRFRDKAFETYVATSLPQRRALTAVKRFAESLANRSNRGDSLVLLGRPGTGKTHLACATVLSTARTGMGARYIIASELLRSIRGTYARDSEQTEEELLDEIHDVWLLVIDEVGAGALSDHGERILFEIIDRRYRELRPTILITNLPNKDLESTIGERIIDRLREIAVFVAFDWPTHRGRTA